MRGSSQPLTCLWFTSCNNLRLLIIGVAQIEARKLDLLRMARRLQLVKEPVVQGAMVFEFQGTDGVGDALDRIRYAMRIVVHGVDAPRIVRADDGRRAEYGYMTGSRIFRLPEAMSILARRGVRPFENSQRACARTSLNSRQPSASGTDCSCPVR